MRHFETPLKTTFRRSHSHFVSHRFAREGGDLKLFGGRSHGTRGDVRRFETDETVWDGFNAHNPIFFVFSHCVSCGSVGRNGMGRVNICDESIVDCMFWYVKTGKDDEHPVEGEDFRFLTALRCVRNDRYPGMDRAG